jgi:hypothetical protein
VVTLLSETDLSTGRLEAGKQVKWEWKKMQRRLDPAALSYRLAILRMLACSCVFVRHEQVKGFEE